MAGVGNGDPSSHEPDHAIQRQAFNGWCMALVQALDSAGTITVTATAPGLQAASASLQSSTGAGSSPAVGPAFGGTGGASRY